MRSLMKGMLAAVALLIALPLSTYAIQPDAPYLALQKKSKQKWAAEDRQIDQKLATLFAGFALNVLLTAGILYAAMSRLHRSAEEARNSQRRLIAF